MAEKMIKHLFFTYGEARPNPMYYEGGEEPQEVIVEAIAHLGEVVDIIREYDLNRGEELDAFYTDDEREAIEEGTYAGPDAEVVYSAINSESGMPQVTAQTSAPGQVSAVTPISDMSADEVASLIQERGLNVEETIALAGNDPDQIEKVLDAEDQLDNGPRKGVTVALDKRLAEATTGEGNGGEG